MGEKFWLRGEDKKNEFRRALSPGDCAKLLSHGHKVVVEDWRDSIIATKEYAEVGCEIQPKNAWKSSDAKNIIVGLKYLPNDLSNYNHRHIYFAHAFKGQEDAHDILSKFSQGKGKIIDLEFMVDDRGRRVCAFGYWAGYVGAALAILRRTAKDKNKTFDQLKRKQFFRSRNDLLNFISEHCEQPHLAKPIVIGANGRSGQGAVELFREVGVQVKQWDLPETKKGGPFKEILDHDILVNCVLSMTKIPPFLTTEMLGGNLKVISDVSCDPDSDCNVLPLYDRATTLDSPVHLLKNGVELLAIDNLPSILPLESSQDFSSQLVENLINFKLESETPITRSFQIFQRLINEKY